MHHKQGQCLYMTTTGPRGPIVSSTSSTTCSNFKTENAFHRNCQWTHSRHQRICANCPSSSNRVRRLCSVVGKGGWPVRKGFPGCCVRRNECPCQRVDRCAYLRMSQTFSLLFPSRLLAHHSARRRIQASLLASGSIDLRLMQNLKSSILSRHSDMRPYL